MNAALRVLCIGHADSPQFSQRCALLRGAGFRVTELTGRAAPATPGADAAQPRGLPLGRCWRLTALTRCVHFFALARALDPDVIFVQYAQGLWAWLATATGRPVVVSVMGGDVLFDEQHDPGAVQRAATRGCLRRAALALCKSEYLAERVRAMRPRGQVRVMAWGVDRSLFRPASAGGEKRAERRAAGLPESGLLLLAPRALQPLYNPGVILRAFARSGLANQGAHLALCTFRADPACEAGLRELRRELNLEKSVLFLPPQDAAGMARLYRASDLGISVPESDGLPQTLFEAAACGLPLILRDLPNYNEVLRHGEQALLVAARGSRARPVEFRPDELAAALRLLAADPDLRAALAQGAARLLQEQEARFGDGLLPELFQEAAKRPGAGRLARAAQTLRAAACLFAGPAPAARQGQPTFSGFRSYFRELAHPLPGRNASRKA
ncbi:glycosyltransferase [Paucidesulfovibrio longus]|uniref:glycosyltransferase n=1 Tax=Paucidesulfovibrio longus TaxID=889 RepID=UPI0003B3B4EB|nr:glycosyltransferase [Paucidesulfovibrio longus]